MKRALSLILVLAMVLCLVPFSAFAAEWNLNGDYQDGTVTFTETVLESSALYTAPDVGTVYFSLSNYSEGLEGVNIYIDGSEDPYVLDTEIEVTPDQPIEVTVASDSELTGTVDISSTFKTLPGTEGNPLYLSGYNTTPVVGAGESIWLNLYGAYGGQEVTVNQAFNDYGVDFTVYHKNADSTSVTDWDNYIDYAQFTGVGSWRGEGDVICITNNLDVPMYYVLSGVYPAGTQMNPEWIYAGSESVATVDAGTNGYYYQYTPWQDGTITIDISAADAEGNALGWFFVVNNNTTYESGEMEYSSDETVVYTYDVSSGDEIVINVNTFDPADQWNAPAGTVTVNLSFTATPEEVKTVVAQLNGTDYYTVADALAAAVSGDVVTMVADSHEENTNLIIGSGVTLDLVNFNLYAKSVVGFAESVLDACYEDAAGNGADLYVAKNSLVLLGTAAYNRVTSRNTRQILPVWVESTAETDVAHYIFTDVMVVDKGFDNTINEGDTVELNFQTAFTGHVRTTYLRNPEGIDGNGLSIIAGFSWFDEGIVVSQEYFYTDDLVYNQATNNKPLLAGFNGCLNLQDLHVWIEFVADCGLVVSGAYH